jgi:hypothetical protein
MASPVLQFKRGAFANLPALSAGEPGFTTDRYDLYIGTGAGTTESNIFVGSQRFWSVGTASTGSGVKFVEGTGNGTNDILIKAPDTLSASYTLTLPSDDGVANSVLTSDGSGNLSWGAGSANSTLTGITTVTGTFDVDSNNDFSGITTFSNTTDNTLGDADTGAVQIDGGLGIAKNVTIGAGLSVTGNSYFVGMVTFAGGTNGNISIGDSTGDNIIVNGRIDSDLIPDDDGTYDLGSSSLEWRDLYIDGTANIDSLVADTAAISDLTDNRVVIAGTSGELEDDGNLTYDGTDLSTNSLIVTDLTDNRVLIAGTGGAVEDDANLTFNGSVLNVGVALTVTGAINGNGGADISGGETTLSSATVSDLTSGRVVLAGTSGALEDSGNLTFDGTTLTVTGAAAIDNVTIDGNTVSTSAGGLTLDSTSGTTTVADDLTVNGTLTVLGTQSIINTETLKVEDSLVEVGLVNSGGDLVAPSSDANIDVGLIFHYYSGSAKKAAVYWDDSVSRIVVASEVSESGSVLTATADSGYGELEIRALHINDCAGASQVISCTGSERFLENITIDGGTFV